MSGVLPKEADLLGGAGSRIRQEVVMEDKAGGANKIAVIDVKGLLVSGDEYGSAGTDAIVKVLEAARKDRNVVAIILDMDTPGGGVVASEEVHHAVQQARDAGTPVVTCMHSMGASGGYLIAAGTDHIVANRLTLTGSVGVVVGTLNYAGLFGKIGLESEVYKSGEMKDMLHGGRERTEAEKTLVDELVRANFEEFAAIVAAGRERYADAQDVLRAEFADGRVLTGRQALDMGLVDELGYFEDAVNKAKELAKVSEARVVRFRRALRFLDLFSMRAAPFDGISRLLPAEVRLLKPGQLYFVMPSAVP
jgi:protease-4